MSTKTSERVHVVYARPRDFPNGFVVRGWSDGTPERGCIVLPTREKASAWCRALGLVRLGRDPECDPVIAEVWGPIDIAGDWPFGLHQLSLEVERGTGDGEGSGA